MESILAMFRLWPFTAQVALIFSLMIFALIIGLSAMYYLAVIVRGWPPAEKKDNKNHDEPKRLRHGG